MQCSTNLDHMSPGERAFPALRRLTRNGALAALVFSTSGPALATPYIFEDVYALSGDGVVGLDLAKPVVADNGTVAFLEIVDFASDERYLAVNDSVANDLLQGNTAIRPLNLSGPGVSENGVHFAFRARESTSGGATDRLYVTTIGGPIVKVAEPGDLINGIPGDPLGAASCSGTCQVLNDGSLYFKTLNPQTLTYGSGGDLNPFAIADDLGVTFIEDFRASNNGFAAAVFQTGIGDAASQEFVIGVRDDTDPNKAETAQLFLDTDGIYEEFRFPTITDDAEIAILADRDSGGQHILTRLASEALTPKITTDGFFDTFDDLSFARGGHLAFAATVDLPGGQSIFAGPDVVKDRVLGPGDVVFGKTVKSVEIAPYDAVNANGQIVMAVEFTDGSASIVRAARITQQLIQNSVAVLASGGFDTTSSLSQLVQLEPGLFDLGFEFDFLNGDGLLEVLLGGQLLGAYTPENSGAQLITGLDARDFGPEAELLFRLIGDPDASLQLDDIVLPGLRNGDFETGYLDGWRVASDGGVVAVVSRTSVVPLPAGIWLLVGSVAALGGLARRKNGHGMTGRNG